MKKNQNNSLTESEGILYNLLGRVFYDETFSRDNLDLDKLVELYGRFWKSNGYGHLVRVFQIIMFLTVKKGKKYENF